MQTLNKNQVSLTMKSQSGGLWEGAVFNVHQKVRHVLHAALDHFGLGGRQGVVYEVLYAQDGRERSLSLDGSLQDYGVRTGDLLLVRTVGQTIDG